MYIKLLNKSGLLLCLVFLTTFPALASAENGEDRLVNQRLLQLLDNLQPAAPETALAQAVPAGITSRVGTFNFTITVNRVSKNSEPIGCGAVVVHTNGVDSYREEASGKIIWRGNTGISIPYIWKNANTSASFNIVGIGTSISPYFPCTTTCVERPISHHSNHGLGSMPLPANGAKTPLADTFRL
jgi:hypothetical protein